MLHRFVIFLFLTHFAIGSLRAEERTVAQWLKELQAAGKQGAGSPAARAAWAKLVDRGPKVLPQLLEALDTPDTVVANWLRTAFDRIVDNAGKNGGKDIDVDALLAFVKDPKRQGRARRLALEVVEQLRPGTRDRLLTRWLDDPEFRYEAVAAAVEETETLDPKADKDRAIAAFRKAFAAARDVSQAQTVAGRLKNLGVTVSVAEHFGCLTDWYVIGPFDARDMKGFTTIYPPEEKLDLTAEHDGKQGKIRWKRFRLPEPAASSGPRIGLINLLQPLGQADDAVAYAYTEFRVPAAEEVEFRGAGDDNLTVWVNGQRVFGFEEYRNGVRFDRHRFRVRLRAGVNTVLVKVCQAPFDAANGDPNWEFFLRVVDETGKGLKVQGALPADK
jgi:hypothetical protein